MRFFAQPWLRYVRMGMVAGILAVVLLPQVKLPAHADTASVDAWWPKNGTVMTGVQPLKAAMTDRPVGDYRMTWRVDGGTETGMFDSAQDYPHKEAMVDVSGWTWKGAGPYIITYSAYSPSGDVIDTTSVSFSTSAMVSQTQASVPAPVAPVMAAAPVAPVRAADPVTSGLGKLYVDPSSPAARQAAEWRTTRPADAAMMDKIAGSATPTWFGGWNADVRGDVARLVGSAAASGSAPVLVAYNIPARDCGSYSAGGAPASAYGSWIQAFASGLGGKRAIVVLEPDALAQATCLSSGDQAERYRLLAGAVGTIKAADPQAKVYLDAGHAGWIPPADMADRLTRAGIDRADGFSVNVSNFLSTSVSQGYGHLLSAATGGKHFVIDTSRNGQGAANGDAWCNPSGRGLGLRPTTATNDSLADAYLWVKTPGESDGNCNGGPGAGVWWPDYALGLAQRASF